jgi:hypothetical protein
MTQVSVLNEVSGYDELQKYFDEHKDKPWDEWLEVDESFRKAGKQGVVGLLKPTLVNMVGKYIFKVSQNLDYLMEHEGSVMEGLNKISHYCPHFIRYIGNVKRPLNGNCGKDEDPLRITSAHTVNREVLIAEYIPNSRKFFRYIECDTIPERVLYSITKQTLLAIVIAQKRKFAHYDLHSDNVLVRKCNKNLVFVYSTGDGDQYAVPTHGYYPTIIDFGYSYISDLEDGPMYAPGLHTDVGFMSHEFDWVGDPKLFLVTVSNEIKEARGTRLARRFRRIVKNMFDPLDIDFSSGWDKEREKSALEEVIDMVEEYNEVSDVFSKYDIYAFSILQTLIILPLEAQDYTDIGKVYATFIKHWTCIESEITNPYYCLYILQGIVDAARAVRAAYVIRNTRRHALKTFQQQVTARIEEVASYCLLEDLNFEVLLCSLYVLSENMEGVLHDAVTARMKEKSREYRKMPLQSTLEIYGAIEANIPDKYEYNDETICCIVDSTNEVCDIFKINDEDLDEVNNTHPLMRGTLIYDLYICEKLGKEKEDID